ncbi:MAG: P-loop NTPase fold protein [Rhizobium sp.]|nr:P-loop NTPase fold protein [Rhizobium sp.]
MSDIWSDDFLNRKEDADFLFAYLIERNNLAVRRGNKGTSINVNAPWGAGKSFFLSRFALHLRAKGHLVAEVDAWRDDHAEDPIFAVMAAILKVLDAGKDKKNGKLRTALSRSAGKIAIRTGQGLLRRASAVFIGSDQVEGIADILAKSLTESSETTINDYAESALQRFEEGKMAIEQFRSTLEQSVAGNKPLFVLIDELDRCRPTYAVSVLERIKHLFDVPNVIFVFATDADQLVHTIKSVYGTDFDAERYLHRFFDRTYQFDSPPVGAFIKARWQELGFSSERFVYLEQMTEIEIVTKISVAMNLQLRDIHQCLDILWSFANFERDDLKIPLLFAYPLICAYHLRNLKAMAAACNETPWDGTMKAEYPNCFNGTVILTSRRRGDDGRYITRDHSLLDIMSAFLNLIRNGLSERGSSDNPVSSYVETYRRHEVSVIFNNQDRYDSKMVSHLENYGSAVRRAGRVAPTKN